VQLKKLRDGQTEATLHLFGVNLTMIIPRIDSPRLACNQTAIVHMVVDRKQLIEQTGARYSAGRLNTPTVQSPIHQRIEKAANAKARKRRVLPHSTKELVKKFQQIQIGKYSINFTLSGQDYQLSLYNEHSDLETTYKIVSALTDIDLASVEIYFSHHLSTLVMLPDLDHSEFERIVGIVGKSKNEVLTYLNARVRMLPKLIGKDKAEVLEILSL
jgi:hypothetical protein